MTSFIPLFHFGLLIWTQVTVFSWYVNSPFNKKKKKKFWTTNPPEYYIIILLAVKGNISVHTCVRMPHFLSDKNPHECKVAVRFKMNEGEKEDPFILTGLSRYISDSVKTGSLISMLPMAGAPCQVEYYFFFFLQLWDTVSFAASSRHLVPWKALLQQFFFFFYRDWYSTLM